MRDYYLIAQRSKSISLLYARHSLAKINNFNSMSNASLIVIVISSMFTLLNSTVDLDWNSSCICFGVYYNIMPCMVQMQLEIKQNARI